VVGELRSWSAHPNGRGSEFGWVRIEWADGFRRLRPRAAGLTPAAPLLSDAGWVYGGWEWQSLAGFGRWGGVFGGLLVALMAGIAWVDAVETGDGIGVGDARLSRSD